jgi:putative hydrolase of the HAD superfamily
MSRGAIPWRELDTVFLDAGNTLVSMDFAWIGELLAGLGFQASARALERAEARIRPLVSERIRSGARTESEDAFTFYVRSALDALEPALADTARATRELVPLLRRPGVTPRLWSRVLPGVPEALARLRGAGLRLVVVSNSDGTVERGLTDAGLRPLVDHVVDSHLVGIEKPDPRIFHHALSLSASDPARTLHVGDIHAVDVTGARSAGLHALLLDPFGDWPHADCERAADLLELAARFER